jgi:hypothetical protein
MGRRPFRLLLKEDVAFAKHLKDRYRAAGKPLTGAERKRLLDKRRQILRTIDDLRWFAENWPESQLRLIFTTETHGKKRMGTGEESKREPGWWKETRSPFIRLMMSVVDIGTPGPGPVNKNGEPIAGPHALTEEQESKKVRIRKLCNEILEVLANQSAILAPVATDILTKRGGVSDRSQRLQALMIGR